MSEHYDIAVIGTGPGGYIAALKAGQMGTKTAVIEKKAVIGGTCLNWGCIPSKALLASAELMHEIRNASKMGVGVPGEPTFDWSAIQKRKDKVLATLRGGIANLFKARGVTLYMGKAVFDGPGKMTILSEKKEPESITADKVIIASGSEPTVFGGWPTEREYVCTSDEALHWKELPKSLLIVGGGIIGCEFACMMTEFGVDTTVVELMPRLMPVVDGHLAEALQKDLTKRGVKFMLETKVEDMAVKDGGVTTRLSNGETLKTDRVLVSVGRSPNTAEMGLDKVGLETSKRGFIHVNDKMETPVKGHYAIGDVNGRILLAHAAEAHGVVAVENALGHSREFNDPVPSAVYTFPEIASVGLSQEDAKEQNIPVAIGSFPIGHLGKAMAAGTTDGFVKVLRNRKTQELLGVHIYGAHATEMIHAAAAMLHERVKTEELAEMVFAHPTLSEAIKEAAEDSLGQALHLPPRKVMRVSVGGAKG